jgi:hypothetical protein
MGGGKILICPPRLKDRIKRKASQRNGLFLRLIMVSNGYL